MAIRTTADMVRDLLGVAREREWIEVETTCGRGCGCPTGKTVKRCSACPGNGEHETGCDVARVIAEAEAYLRAEEALEDARDKAHAAAPATPNTAALDGIAAEVIALAPATSTRIADLTYGIRHLATCIDDRGTPPADRRVLFLKIARQAVAGVAIGDAALLAPAAPEIQPTERQRFVARAHLALLRGIANGAGHSRQGATGLAPCIDVGLLEEDELGLGVLTAIGRRALAIETAAQGQPPRKET